MAKKKLLIFTLGCRQNQYDSGAILTEFYKKGFSDSDSIENSDLIIVNTCTVTHRADSKARRLIRQLRRKNHNAIITVIGCYAQVSSNSLKEIEDIDLIIDNVHKPVLVDIVCDYMETNARLKNNEYKNFPAPSADLKDNMKKPVVYHKNWDKVPVWQLNSTFSTLKNRALIKIQDGCNYRCSFCIVPFARGPSVSRPVSSIIDEFKKLLNEGFYEITITGVHIGSYKDDNNINLINLIKKLISIKGDFRIRLSSLDPYEVSLELIHLIKNENNIAKHLHLSIQSGSDDILRLMNRRDNVYEMRKKLELIRKEMPDAGIGADIIVGFPGETDDLFAETFRFIEESPLTYLHIFSYSNRPGTKAFNFPDQVNQKIIKSRYDALKTLGKVKNFVFRKSFLGKKLRTLIEKEKGSNGDFSIGLSDNYIKINLPLNANYPDYFIYPTITNVTQSKTFGVLE